MCQDQPRGHPSVDPSTLGRKTLYELASLKYCYNAELVKAAPDDAASLRLRIKEEVRANVEKRKSQQSMGGGRNGHQLQGE